MPSECCSIYKQTTNVTALLGTKALCVEGVVVIFILIASWQLHSVQVSTEKHMPSSVLLWSLHRFVSVV